MDIEEIFICAAIPQPETAREQLAYSQGGISSFSLKDPDVHIS